MVGAMDEDDPTRRSDGIYVARGMTLQIPAGGLVLSFDKDGRTDVKATVHVSLDVYPHWLAVAMDRLDDAECAAGEVKALWDNDRARAAEALEREFLASMQCIVAAATAVDAFYATVRRYIEIPEADREAWKKNRTARYVQISEVLRRGFLMGKDKPAQLRIILKDVYKFRGWSVHPPAKFQEPVVVPDLCVSTDWRFAAFRATNAKPLSGLVLSVIAQLLRRPRGELPELVRYCEGASPLISPPVTRWESRYGPLVPRGQPPEDE
jgi:hypothetical protein